MSKFRNITTALAVTGVAGCVLAPAASAAPYKPVCQAQAATIWWDQDLNNGAGAFDGSTPAYSSTFRSGWRAIVGLGVVGTSGDDVITGSSADDLLSGGPGNDRLCGWEGNDELRGDAGHDFLYGGDGNDELRGGDGSDYLNGGFGDDDLNGGAGNDKVDGGPGADYVIAEATDKVVQTTGDFIGIKPVVLP
jgi:Ca2+-binding RTX toxin-like protein